MSSEIRKIDVCSPKRHSSVSGAHADSYLMSNLVLSVGAKRDVCEANCSPRLHLEPGLRRVELYLRSHLCLHGVHKETAM
jgi:hypothetical protein